MKSLAALVAAVSLAAKVSAHYVFPDLIVGGVPSTDWQFTRQTNNWQDLNPLMDVTLTDVRCYTSLESGTSGTQTVSAGSTITWTVSGNPSNLYHDGVVNVYMAKAPSGTDVASWDGSGEVWFKIFEIPAVTDGGTTITFPSTGLTEVTVTIPAQVPSGQYLVRVEQIALHVADVFQGAQFYIACTQLNVINGGTGTPGPLVAFPGAYTEPGILINIYWPIPTNYTQPGPPVWPAVGSGSPAPPSSSTGATTSVKSTTAPPTTTIATTTPTKASTTSSTPSSTGSPPGGTVAEWGQCGGEGYAGPTTCASPFTCTVLNPFYSQCV